MGEMVEGTELVLLRFQGGPYAGATVQWGITEDGWPLPDVVTVIKSFFHGIMAMPVEVFEEGVAKLNDKDLIPQYNPIKYRKVNESALTGEMMSTATHVLRGATYVQEVEET